MKTATQKRKATSKPQKAHKAAKPQKATTAAAKPQKAASKPQNATGIPYRQGGGYWATVEALRTLGSGKLHSHAAILAAYKKAMGADAWKALAKRDGKLSTDQRAMLNVSVVARKDYGKPLREVGYEVRWDGREKVAGLFKV
ncbi:MAG TPA: hypothetical protein VF669_08770 [Tepidisphaeraceae bacterium]|jgi:hypothetical protein